MADLRPVRLAASSRATLSSRGLIRRVRADDAVAFAEYRCRRRAGTVGHAPTKAADGDHNVGGVAEHLDASHIRTVDRPTIRSSLCGANARSITSGLSV